MEGFLLGSSMGAQPPGCDVGWGGLCSLVGTLGWLELSVWVTAWAARSLGSVTLIVAVVVLPLCNSKSWTSVIYSCLFLVDKRHSRTKCGPCSRSGDRRGGVP